MGAREQDPLAVAGDGYYKVDYSEEVALTTLARNLAVDVIVPGCNDLSYGVCNRLSQSLDLSSLEPPEVVAALHSKDLFRDLCRSLSIPAPNHYRTVAAASASGKPVVVKPTDAYSGHGVEVLLHPSTKELQQAILRSKQHSKNRNVLLEEFVQGDLFSYSAFMDEGRVVTEFHVAEFGSVNPFVVDTSFVISPPEFAPELRCHTETLARELGIRAGLMHLQYIATENCFWVIEPTRRCPGDLYSRLIELSTGYPYADAYVSSFLGGQPPVVNNFAARNVVRHTVTGSCAGVLQSLAIKTNVAITEWIPLATVGEKLDPSPKGRVAVAFFEAKDLAERDALVHNLLSGQVFRISYA